jgi:hypothetical protein
MKLFFGTLITTILCMLIFNPREDFCMVETVSNTGEVDTLLISKANYDKEIFYSKIITVHDSADSDLNEFRIPKSKIKSHRLIEEFQYP